MISRSPGWRGELSRALSRRMRMGVGEILTDAVPLLGSAHRIGFTGPPGGGKSSLISAIAQLRIGRERDVGVIAIDPSSPISGGALLGDRIRMGDVDSDRFFVRSVSSGTSHDGLCRNVLGLLGTLEEFGFDDIVLETVGVGQVSYEARYLVDTLALVIVPESGDTVQAMKAGLMEMADLYIVNKADRPAAERTAAELRSVLYRSHTADGWQPPVLLTSVLDGRGIDAVAEAIDAHRRTLTAQVRSTLESERRRYQVRAVFESHIAELLAARTNWAGASLEEASQRVGRDLRALFDQLGIR